MTGLVLMTALPPTEGHLTLCRFAAAHARAVGSNVIVLMCVLPDEPPGRGEHRDALAEALRDEPNVRVEIQFSNDPQGPVSDDDDKFWAHWVRVVTRQSGERITTIYSSERYGYQLAESLGAVHVPFDAGREVTSAKATGVRADVVGNFRQIIKPLRDRLRRRVVLFGQESVGKSTLAKWLAEGSKSVYAPEWARTYLEGFTTPEVTSERMDQIAAGQHAHETASWRLAADLGSPFVFYDTDLLSTIGYDEYYASANRWERDGSYSRRRNKMEEWFVPADLYLVCAPTIPMTPDPLRYGGAERETSMKFWIRMLEERGLNYDVVTAEGRTERQNAALRSSLDCLRKRAGFCDYART